MIRDAYQAATDWFVRTVAQVEDAAWEQPALGEWTVRDLVGHTHRALLTVEAYLDRPAETATLSRAVDYFLQARASLADPAATAAVATRGREAGKALGDNPLATVRATAARVQARLLREPDEALLTSPFGGMRLIDYLPSRVFELTIHTLDLAAATSQQMTVPPSAAQLTVALVGEMAYASGNLASLLLAVTGRHPLPPGYSLI